MFLRPSFKKFLKKGFEICFCHKNSEIVISINRYFVPQELYSVVWTFDWCGSAS